MQGFPDYTGSKLVGWAMEQGQRAVITLHVIVSEVIGFRFGGQTSHLLTVAVGCMAEPSGASLKRLYKVAKAMFGAEPALVCELVLSFLFEHDVWAPDGVDKEVPGQSKRGSKGKGREESHLVVEGNEAGIDDAVQAAGHITNDETMICTNQEGALGGSDHTEDLLQMQVDELQGVLQGIEQHVDQWEAEGQTNVPFSMTNLLFGEVE